MLILYYNYLYIYQRYYFVGEIYGKLNKRKFCLFIKDYIN